MKFNYIFKVSTSNLTALKVLNKIISYLSLSYKIVTLPKRKKRFVLIKSPHVNSKSKEHFQYIRFQRLYYLQIPSLYLLKIFLLKIPNDLNIKIKKINSI